MHKLSVIVSVYNEEKALYKFYYEIIKVLENITWDYEIIFVNDGSKDKSLIILKEFSAKNNKVKVINFSKNFGHEAAMIAGIDNSNSDAIICMDADLQHPPKLIPEIILGIEDGKDVITMVRTQNRSAGVIKNITSFGFYWFINKISDIYLEPNASDFFAISKRVVEVLKTNYREHTRFLRGYIQNLGFHKMIITYEAQPRIAGESKYSLKKLFIFSINTILCFSNFPLKIGTFSGAICSFLGIALLFYTLFTRSEAPNGYATIVIFQCFMFAMLFFVVGIIGQYISVLFAELKDRPIYIIEEKINFH